MLGYVLDRWPRVNLVNSFPSFALKQTDPSVLWTGPAVTTSHWQSQLNVPSLIHACMEPVESAWHIEGVVIKRIQADNLGKSVAHECKRSAQWLLQDSCARRNATADTEIVASWPASGLSASDLQLTRRVYIRLVGIHVLFTDCRNCLCSIQILLCRVDIC